MMLQTLKNGQTSVVLRIKLLDSSKTDGSGLTGLTSASTGLIISTIADNEASATTYTVAGSTIEAVTTLGTYAAPTATKCRFKEVDATNHPGIYELQIADARFAVSGAKSILVSLSGATNLAQTDFVVQLQSDDPYVAKPTNYASLSIDGSGHVTFANTSIATVTDLTNLPSIPSNWITAAGIAASALNGKGDWNVGKTGYSLSTAGVDAIWDEPASTAFTTGSMGLLVVDNLDTTVSSRLPTSSYTAPDNSDIVAIKAKTDSLTFTVAGVVDSNVVDWKGSTAPANTGDAYARLGAPAGASIAADIAAVPTAGENASAVWEESTGAHATSGTMGVALENAASAGDPWSTPLPGAYGAGTAGNIVGNNLDAAVSTRLATSGYTSPPSAATISTQVWSEAVPGSFGTGSAGMVLGDNLDTTISSRLATSGYTAPDNSDIVAIKAKTDNLPASPAAVSDIPSAASIATTVWDEATSSLTLTGSIGALLVNDIDAAISTRAAAGDAMTLTTAYDSAKTAAKTTDLPTNFSAMSIDASGNVSIAGNLKKNTAKSGFMFVMTDSTNHAPATGLTVTATRSIDGAAFAACTNSVTAVSSGVYTINLSAADMNGDHIMLRFTATGADDLNIEIVTQP